MGEKHLTDSALEAVCAERRDCCELTEWRRGIAVTKDCARRSYAGLLGDAGETGLFVLTEREERGVGEREGTTLVTSGLLVEIIELGLSSLSGVEEPLFDHTLEICHKRGASRTYRK